MVCRSTTISTIPSSLPQKVDEDEEEEVGEPEQAGFERYSDDGLDHPGSALEKTGLVERL